MILQKYMTKKIPSFRHKKDVYIFDQDPHHYKFTKKKSSTCYIKRKKRIYKNKYYSISTFIIKLNTYVTKQYFYQTKPYRKYMLCETYNNMTAIIPSVTYLTIGKVLYSTAWTSKDNVNFYYRGFIAHLSRIPTFSIFCNVTNLNNNKVTYAKSGGTYCILRKNKKTKSKLITIVLPSQTQTKLVRSATVFLGKNTNFNTHKLVEGKWGFSLHAYKKIKVRGVAMNPVDHPNGGRTKSVQPERSPWNWIAKKGK